MHSHKQWFNQKIFGQTSLMSMYKQMRMYKSFVIWLLSNNLTLFLTWLQSSWKRFEPCIQDESEQEVWF